MMERQKNGALRETNRLHPLPGQKHLGADIHFYALRDPVNAVLPQSAQPNTVLRYAWAIDRTWNVSPTTRLSALGLISVAA